MRGRGHRSLHINCCGLAWDFRPRLAHRLGWQPRWNGTAVTHPGVRGAIINWNVCSFQFQTSSSRVSNMGRNKTVNVYFAVLQSYVF